MEKGQVEAKFGIGQQVMKIGDYELPGEVLGIIVTKAGKVRYVVEHPPGFLHIYSEHNLKAADAPQR